MKELNTLIRKTVNLALDKAEANWSEVGHLIEMRREDGRMIKASFEEAIPSKIPGHEKVSVDKPEVGDFIALVMDIRDSTKHLMISRNPKPEMLQRVYYETTAMNTAGAVIIDWYKGGLTEYLGDGFLSLFNIEDEKEPIEVYSAHNAAKSCIGAGRDIVNDIIDERYRLPNLNIGVGMAYSKAMVTTVGLPDNLHPKAIGQCVYRATKLSNGFNEINVDVCLKELWPSTKEGKIGFGMKRSFGQYADGYKLTWR